jgi:hypothetical protein
METNASLQYEVSNINLEPKFSLFWPFYLPGNAVIISFEISFWYFFVYCSNGLILFFITGFRLIEMANRRDLMITAPKHCPLQPMGLHSLLACPKSIALFACLIICTFQLIFSARTVFFSHNKSANSTFSHDFSAKRTGPNHVSKHELYRELFCICAIT